MSPALRTFASVVSGYFLMGVLVFALDFGVGLAFADSVTEGAEDGVVQFSGGAPILIIMLAGSVLAAIAGGALAGKVGDTQSGGNGPGPRILAALVLVLGVMSNLSGAPAYPAMIPNWYIWSIPILGTLGVMLGARLVESTPDETPME